MSSKAPGAVAALDCGTNSTRLLVAAPDGGTVARFMRVTRLGEGVDASRKLTVDAIDRTVAVLGEYRAVMDASGVVRARMVATSAVRDAVNGEELLQVAAKVIGVGAELLAGEEEGRLAYAGATLGLGAVEGDDVVVDIGGGSTELVVAGPEGLGVVSLDLGCVRLTERYLRHDPPLTDEIDAALEAVNLALDRATASVPRLSSLPSHSRLLGLAGSVSTLVALDLGLDRYDRARLHHAVLSREAVGRWCEILGQEPSRARSDRPGMVEGREDVILGGALILREVMDRFGFDRCVHSESDILDGIVGELLAQDR